MGTAGAPLPEMQIQWDGMTEIGDAERAAVESRLWRIAAQHDDLSVVRIAGRESWHHRRGGREVHVSGRTRGREIAARRTGSELEPALHDAVDAFARELRKLRARGGRRLGEHLGGRLSAP